MNNYQFVINKKQDYYEIINREKNIHILVKKYSFGKNIFWGKNIKTCNSDSSPMDSFIIGDNVFIDHDVTIMVPSCTVLDYTKINNSFYAYGTNPLKIGYNCWFGSAVLLDTLGGLSIGNNVCVNSQSQIYSHTKFGDMLYGCRFNSYKSVTIGDDVWIASNVTVTLASMEDKSMLLAGSVLTKSTKYNHVYAGIPAKDITSKTGPQFNTNLNYKLIFEQLEKLLTEFYKKKPNFKVLNSITIKHSYPKKIIKNKSYFIIKERKYTKTGSDSEIAFMKFLLPDKAKFTPYKN